jgi:hypothetical protein
VEEGIEYLFFGGRIDRIPSLGIFGTVFGHWGFLVMEVLKRTSTALIYNVSHVKKLLSNCRKEPKRDRTGWRGSGNGGSGNGSRWRGYP